MKKLIRISMILFVSIFGMINIHAAECSSITDMNTCKNTDGCSVYTESRTQSQYCGTNTNASSGTSSQNSSVSQISTKSCGTSTEIPAALPTFIHNIINIVKIIVPVMLVILGMLDFGKAVTSNDEKTMKESQNKFIKRIIGAIAIFLVVAVTQFIFNIIGNKNTNEIVSCINCFVNDNCYNLNKFTCSNYSTDDCPSFCTVENNRCVRPSTPKTCTDYSFDECPKSDENGDLCTQDMVGHKKMCTFKYTE